MGDCWIVERGERPRFPYRITIEQGERPTLVLRAAERWPGPGAQVFCIREKTRDRDEPLEELERVPIASLRRLGRKLSLTLDRPTRKRCDFLFLEKPYRNKPGTYEQIFFRTQMGLRKHPARMRGQVARTRRLEIWIDSAERYPWKFPNAEVSRHRLPAGDYALAVRDEPVAFIERKTFDNLISDLVNVQILHQQLAGLASYPRSAMLIEAHYGDFLRPDKVGRWSTEMLAARLAEIQAMHAGLPMVFAGSRKLAAQWVYRYFLAAAAALSDLVPDQVGEAAARYQPAGSPGLDLTIRQQILHELPDGFPIALLRKRFREVPDDRLRRILVGLRDEGRIECRGRGRAARWFRT